MNLCINCKFYKRGGFFNESLCHLHAHQSKPDPVTGRTQTLGISYCASERQSGGLFSRNCGPKGRHFEPMVTR